MSIIKVKDFKKQIVESKKVQLDELVNGDGGPIDGDTNINGNSEIQTGPVEKPFNDTSDFEKGVSTTTDRAAKYRQSLPWFVNYSSQRGRTVSETITKDRMQEKIEDIVKKNKYDGEISAKNFDSKVDKVLDIIQDSELNDEQIESIKAAILAKKAELKNI